MNLYTLNIKIVSGRTSITVCILVIQRSLWPKVSDQLECIVMYGGRGVPSEK